MEQIGASFGAELEKLIAAKLREIMATMASSEKKGSRRKERPEKTGNKKAEDGQGPTASGSDGIKKKQKTRQERRVKVTMSSGSMDSTMSSASVTKSVTKTMSSDSVMKTMNSSVTKTKIDVKRPTEATQKEKNKKKQTSCCRRNAAHASAVDEPMELLQMGDEEAERSALA